jgi:hypothetical protein
MGAGANGSIRGGGTGGNLPAGGNDGGSEGPPFAVGPKQHGAYLGFDTQNTLNGTASLGFVYYAPVGAGPFPIFVFAKGSRGEWDDDNLIHDQTLKPMATLGFPGTLHGRVGRVDERALGARFCSLEPGWDAATDGVAERPEMQRVFFISGYPGDSVMRHGVLCSKLEYLQRNRFNPGSVAR